MRGAGPFISAMSMSSGVASPLATMCSASRHSASCKARCDEARDFLLHHQRCLAGKRRRSRRRPVDGRRVGALAADDLDQRQQVGRVERVADRRCVRAWRNSPVSRSWSGPRSMDPITTSSPGNARPSRLRRVPASDLQPFRRALLHELRASATASSRSVTTRSRSSEAARRKAQFRQADPGSVSTIRRRRMGSSSGVMQIGRDVIAPCQEMRGPAAADRPGAEARDALDVPEGSGRGTSYRP
jgi:hypothetical protein